jgi:glutamine synthetase
MKPVYYCRDPFRGGNNILVLTEAWVWADAEFKTKKPANTNFRTYAEAIFTAAAHEEPWFGIEQEYSLLDTKNKFTIKPLGWPSGGFPGAQGPYYCSVGAGHCYGRVIMDAHYKACLFAGVKIAGTNAEVMPGQWEFQVGPCLGIEMGDHLWMARYLLGRVAEDFNVQTTFSPKIFKEYNGAGCHTNYSTKTMRADNSMDYIDAVMAKLSAKHILHLEFYGDNSQRLTGEHETSKPDVFSYGVGHRGASCRIPTSTAAAKKGYVEDRRPASDIDPYVVSSLIADTTVLDNSLAGPLLLAYREWRQWRLATHIEM